MKLRRSCDGLGGDLVTAWAAILRRPAGDLGSGPGGLGG
jgi:hypothetical protein